MMTEQTDIPLGQDFALELEQFHTETRARPDELAAIRRRLRTANTEGKRPKLRLLSIGTLGAVAAAGLAVALWPTDPVAQQVALSAEQWSEVQASNDVLLSFSGQGNLHTEGKVHDIDWKTGRLNVSVTPNQNIDLTVSTPEATVSVVGTVFEVRRDTLGTTITVERGKVEVSCGEQTPFYLEADGTHTCLPNTAMGLLNRAQDLKTTDPDAALESIALGLADLDETSTDFDDLHYRAAEIHHDAGRSAEALQSARAALTADATYAEEANHIAAKHGMIESGCAEASAHLAWLADNEHAEASELALLAQCTVDSDPDAARLLFEEAEARTTDPGLKEKIRSRIERLH
ncbi:MAG: hypothetical protein ACI8RZ_005703 [Myxococcota bacterium]|jgi:hypothetical protein